MINTSPFVIYNAAAGSGKTFTIVKEYLKIILTSKKEDYYKYILGITFTNKAVAEMKRRIIKNLVSFSINESLTNHVQMLEQISEETKLSKKEIHLRSKKVVKHLLHHYSSFSVETIDHFNHRLIRTFAKDLKLSGNFEVSLDTPLLNEEAVDQLISRAGENKMTTQVLVNFALEKTDNDRSWDISRDIAKVSKLLFNENEVDHVKELKRHSLKNFISFRNGLLKQRESLVEYINSKAQNVLNEIVSKGIPPEAFRNKTLYNHFLKILEGNYKIYDNQLLQNLEDGGLSLYKKDTSDEIASKIDVINPFLLDQYREIKQEVFRLLLIKNILRNITPLSVINLVGQEVEIIKEEKNIIPISEFNTLIHSEIKDQPAPFIYERLGEKYRHFFIDEFQDTSQLQWQNLIPLIDNALSQEYDNEIQGSLMLVGDAKQSIYRWRGGLPEQFISLSNKVSPFSEQPKVLTLSTNYRSCKEIIHFNNSFFTFVAKQFGDPLHTELYETGTDQLTHEREGGYVRFQFIEAQNMEETHGLYAQEILDTIISLKEKGYQEDDICILTRKRDEGISIGQFLIENGVSIISTETLLLEHSNLVKGLVNAIKLSLFPDQDELKVELLYFLHNHFSIQAERHCFLESFLNISSEEFSKLLNEYDIDFNLKTMRSLSLYESCEYCIRQFNLNKKSDAYLFGFMDYVYEFDQQPQSSKISFIEEWEIKKDTASIPTGENQKAVQIMTIHKAKGLEFNVVLFPYADIKLYEEKEAMAWYPLHDPDHVFKETLINYNKEVALFGEEGEAIYNKRRNTLELDNLNMLYVTLTRAIEELYVFSKRPKNTNTEKLTNYSDFFIAFLKELELWDDDLSVYEFGHSEKYSQDKNKSATISLNLDFISHSPQQHHLKVVHKDASLWDTEAEERIITGTIIHDAMERIKYLSDLSILKDEIESLEALPPDQLISLFEMIENIVFHPLLTSYFNPSVKVVNERDIITKNGRVLRPDRLVFADRSVTIIDYKTGVASPKHQVQINQYADALIEMGFSVSEKLLVYCSSEQIEINKT